MPCFVISLGEDPLLFRTHTLVGVVSEGMEVLLRMANLALDEDQVRAVQLMRLHRQWWTRR